MTNTTGSTPPLHDMDVPSLSLALRREFDWITTDRREHQMLSEALDTAVLLHGGAQTDNRGVRHLEPVSVIPLRNTLQLIRWGVTDVPVLMTSLLSLAVMHRAERFVQVRLGGIDGGNHYAAALQWVSDNYSPRTAMLIKWIASGVTPERGVVTGLSVIDHDRMVRDRAMMAAAYRVVAEAAFVEDAAFTDTLRVNESRRERIWASIRVLIAQHINVVTAITNPLNELDHSLKTTASANAIAGLGHALDQLRQLDEDVRIGCGLDT